ncbi:MAG: diacylglycerol kinase family protein [Maricaulaceae bacterium]
MTDRIIFFSNSKSQGVRRKGSRLLAFYTAHKTKKYIYTDDPAALLQIEFTAQDHLFIEGGDGTLQKTITGLLNSLTDIAHCPKLSIVAGGLTNQIAANIGLKAKQDADINDAIIAPQRGLRPTPILKLDYMGTQSQYGCLFSTGALPFVTDYYEQKIRANPTGGTSGIVTTLIKAVSGNQAARDKLMPATELELVLRNGKQEILKTGAHLGTIVTTLPSLMMGLDPFWGQGEGDLRVLYADGRARRLVRNLTGVWLGRKSIDRSADGLESFQSDRLTYHYNGPKILDGEKLETGENNGPLTISATPPLPFVATPKS